MNRKEILKYLGSDEEVPYNNIGLEETIKDYFQRLDIGESPKISAFSEEDKAREFTKSIGLEDENKRWPAYYNTLPDFFTISTRTKERKGVGRDDEIVDRTSISPRQLMSLVAQLEDKDIRLYSEFCETMCKIDSLGCQRFWVGRTGISVMRSEIENK